MVRGAAGAAFARVWNTPRVTVDPRETLEAEEKALEARERLGRGLGGWFLAVTAAIVIAIVVVIVVFAM